MPKQNGEDPLPAGLLQLVPAPGQLAQQPERGELTDIFDALPEAQLPDAFERLLDFKLAHVGDWRSDAWRRLLARAEEAGLLDDLIARIEAELDGILEAVEDIRLWLGEETLERRILEFVPNDARAIHRATCLGRTHGRRRSWRR